MSISVNWPDAIKPLLNKYKHHRHPLDYQNLYQLVVMVVLSAQATDKAVNGLAPALFAAYPDMKALSKATPETLFPYISQIRNFGHKAQWLVEIAQTVKKDSDIPMHLEALTALPGIGRKSANVILLAAGKPAEGIVVDLHVVRVAPRLGMATGTDAKKIEKQLMELLPRKEWEAGMALSFLGREICRPKPECGVCLMNTVCAYVNATTGAGLRR